MTPRVAIIGAGVAGLTAALRLLARNIEVTVIDKGNRVGGRMCTRAVRLPDGRTAQFDLGPPLLYVRNPPADGPPPTHHLLNLGLAEFRDELSFQSRPVGRISGGHEPDEYGAVGGLSVNGGMREFAFRLLGAHGRALDLRDNTTVERLVRTEDGWRVHTRSLRDGFECVVHANGLILTPPVPQSLALLAASRIELPDEIRHALSRVTYTRCMSVYGVFTGRDPLIPGGVWFEDGPIEWLSDNNKKGVSDVPWSVTALTTDGWATEHWEQPDERVVEQLLPRLGPWVGEPVGPGHVWVHRWRWARPVDRMGPPCAVVRDLATVFAGDGFARSVPDPVDGAVASGEAAAVRMTVLLTELVRRNDRYNVARPRRYTLEIAVSTPEEARLAEVYGADRLELSTGLEVGGLTPSIGLFREVIELARVPVYVLLRPRGGSFVYSDRELAVMRADAEAFLREGAAGVVFGAITPDGAIDRGACQSLVEAADRRAVFHRAFDFLPNSLEALDELIEIGFERVLTSGRARNAETGTYALAALVQHAGWQIEVLPAGGVRPHNVAELIAATRCDQVHSSARVPAVERLFAAHPHLAHGLGGGTAFSADLVRGLRRVLDEGIEAG